MWDLVIQCKHFHIDELFSAYFHFLLSIVIFIWGIQYLTLGEWELLFSNQKSQSSLGLKILIFKLASMLFASLVDLSQLLHLFELKFFKYGQETIQTSPLNSVWSLLFRDTPYHFLTEAKSKSSQVWDLADFQDWSKYHYFLLTLAVINSMILDL